VPLWQVALIGLRDWVVLGGAVAALVRDGPARIKQMPPSLWGKITTALQFAFLVAVLLDRRAALVLLVPTTLFSAAAAIDYVRRFRQS
jgi:cardiolipin synthase (CMP-forming)